MTQHRISLATAADTLAAIPAILGFTPENSVITIAVAADDQGRHTIAATARLDARDAEPGAGQVAAALARQTVDGNPVTGAMLIAVADTTDTAAALAGLDAHRAELAARGIDVARALHTYTLTTKAAYTDLDTGQGGIIGDTATSDLAIAQSIEGRTIAGRRADIAARFAPADKAIPDSVALAAAATMGDDFLPVTFDELAAVIGAREIPSRDLTARVGLAFTTGHLEVRDAFLAMAVHGHSDAADVFTYIAARLAGQARMQALSIAAYFLYCTGDGAAVNAAIEEVENVAQRHGLPVPSFTQLITTAIGAGMPPRDVATIADVITPAYVAEHIGRVQSYR
jgi:hypothetical protein